MSGTISQHSEAFTKVDWTRFREQIPVARQWTYLDHAAVAAITQRAHDGITEWAQQALFNGDVNWGSWSRQYEQVRGLAATLINSSPDEIGLVPNTSFGIAMVAEGFPWRVGDNVVIPAGEFPSNVYPWMHLKSRGVEVRVVPLDGARVKLDRIADACDSRTRIVSASWVGYVSGFRLDPYELAELAHEKGALFFLDAIQGLGVFPLDVCQGPIDFLSADGHKWMLGPEGAGLFHIKREHLNLIRPLTIGWNSVSQGNDFSRIELNIRDAAGRYESGSQNLVGFIGLLGSLQTLYEFGLRHDRSELAGRVIEVSDYLCARIVELGWPLLTDRSCDKVKSGIVAFEVPGFDSQRLKSQLLDKRIVTSCRAGRLRISIHAYNNEQDIDRLLEAIQTITRG